MAILKQGILGGISGKIGNIVGSSWKGISVVKTKPLSVANPKTAGQVAQRGRMTNVVAFAKVILAVAIKPLWDRFAQGQSGYNAFVSQNIALFDSASPSTPSSLVFSQGKMAATPVVSGSATNGSATVGCVFVDDSGSGFKLATDVSFVCAHNRTQGVTGVSANDVTRADEEIECLLPATAATGDVIDLWLAFRRADGTIVSDSSYIEITV